MKLRAEETTGPNDGGVTKIMLVAETADDEADLARLLYAIKDGREFTAQLVLDRVHISRRRSLFRLTWPKSARRASAMGDERRAR